MTDNNEEMLNKDGFDETIVVSDETPMPPKSNTFLDIFKFVITILMAAGAYGIYVGIQYACSHAYVWIIKTFLALGGINSYLADFDVTSASELTKAQFYSVLNSIYSSNIAIPFLFSTIIFASLMFLTVWLHKKAGKITFFDKHICMESKGWRTFLNVAFAFAFGIAANYTISYMLAYIPFPSSWYEANAKSVGGIMQGIPVVYGLAVVVLGPICEEIIFRGFLYTSLAEGVERFTGSNHRIIVIIVTGVVTSILFGIYHGNPLQGIYTGILSAGLIAVYEIGNRKIIYPILMHMGFNFVAFASIILSKITESIVNL